MIKFRIVIVTAMVLVAVAVAVSGCGGGSSASGPAGLAAPDSLVFVEGKLQTSAALTSNVNSLAKTVAGIDNLGEYIVSQLESSAGSEGESLDFAKEVEPWLGSEAGIAFRSLEKGELSESLIVVQTTNPTAAQSFIDKHARSSKDPFRGASYKGIDFKVGGSKGTAEGVIDEFLVIAEGEKQFKDAVDASSGDSLADEARFTEAISAASAGSLADVYVDVGGVLDQGKGEVDPQALEVLEAAGLDSSEATAVASIVPGSDQLEIDVSSDLNGESAPTGDVSQLLGSLPADSLAALAVPDVGERLEEAVNSLDASGSPPQLPPHKLKSTLSQVGIEIDRIAASFKDAAVFAQGSSRDDLGGALVLTSDSNEAAQAIASFGTLLRGAKVPGVTAVSGKASGFSIHDSGVIGSKPLVIVAKAGRVAIGYGLAGAIRGLSGAGATLDDDPTYKEAVSSLGKTPISGFVEGPAALRLAEALVPRSKTGFWEARPYLKKIRYIAIGRGEDDEVATARVIAGVGK